METIDLTITLDGASVKVELGAGAFDRFVAAVAARIITAGLPAARSPAAPSVSISDAPRPPVEVPARPEPVRAPQPAPAGPRQVMYCKPVPNAPPPPAPAVDDTRLSTPARIAFMAKHYPAGLHVEDIRTGLNRLPGRKFLDNLHVNSFSKAVKVKRDPSVAIWRARGWTAGGEPLKHAPAAPAAPRPAPPPQARVLAPVEPAQIAARPLRDRGGCEVLSSTARPAPIPAQTNSRMTPERIELLLREVPAGTAWSDIDSLQRALPGSPIPTDLLPQYAERVGARRPASGGFTFDHTEPPARPSKNDMPWEEAERWARQNGVTLLPGTTGRTACQIINDARRARGMQPWTIVGAPRGNVGGARP